MRLVRTMAIMTMVVTLLPGCQLIDDTNPPHVTQSTSTPYDPGAASGPQANNDGEPTDNLDWDQSQDEPDGKLDPLFDFKKNDSELILALVIGKDIVPLSEFVTSPADRCQTAHYHGARVDKDPSKIVFDSIINPKTGAKDASYLHYVISLQGHKIPDPAIFSCGFGSVDSLKPTIVEVDEADADVYFKATKGESPDGPKTDEVM